MYTALGIMLAGILLGRIFAKYVQEDLLGRIIFRVIVFLLFLLGIQIGANGSLFASLPKLGFKACIIMLASVAGSIFVVTLAARALARKGLFLSGTKNAR